MVTSMPIALRARTASMECFFNVSATAITPASLSSTARIIAVFPASSIDWRMDSAACTGIPWLAISIRFPRRMWRSPIAARTPCPGMARKALGSSRARAFAVAARTMASPRGCSDPFSAAAASRSTPSSEIAPTGTTSVTDGRPFVRVPVLSNTTVVSLWAFSRYSPPLISRPFSAPFPVPTMIAAGVSMRRAQGHAIIKTAMKNTRAWATDSPSGTHQRKNVSAAIPTTAGPRTDATRSANRWNELDGNLLLLPVSNDAGGPRGQVHELADRVARPPFRILLEVLAEEDEADDDCRGVVIRPLVRKEDAEDREECHDGAVAPRRRRPDCNEHVHVRALVANCVTKAAIEAISGDELDRRGEHEEHEGHRFLEAREPPAQALAEADDEQRGPDPEAEKRPPLEPRHLLLRRGERLEARLGTEVVLPAADDRREVGALVHIHAADWVC